MPKFITKTELETQNSNHQNTHIVGEIYPQIFSNDSKKLDIKSEMKLEVGIIWLGGYILDNSIFPKEKCPICGKEEVLIPYKVIGSILSGCHTIQFYCKSCNEKLVTNDHIEYFRLIYKYILNHREEFKPEQILNNCTKLSNDAQFIGAEKAS